MMQEQNDKPIYPTRKRNRLEGYDYSAAGMYFITICIRNKEKLLGSISDGDDHNPPKMRYSSLGHVIDQQIRSINRAKHVHVEKYVIMPNHIHMILSVEDDTHEKELPENAVIPRTIGGFKRICHKRIGANVFQRSYYDHIIRDQHHFEIIWNYIEDNPRRWKEDCFYVAD